MAAKYNSFHENLLVSGSSDGTVVLSNVASLATHNDHKRERPAVACRQRLLVLYNCCLQLLSAVCTSVWLYLLKLRCTVDLSPVTLDDETAADELSEEQVAARWVGGARP